jgi:hypothetical protein
MNPPLFDQAVDDARVAARKVFGYGFFGAVKNNQGGVGRFAKGARKNDVATVVSFDSRAQMFGANRCAADYKIVYHIVEKRKVGHRACTQGEVFQKPR